MLQGLSGLAAGNSKHQFLQTKMQRLGEMEDQLAIHIGSDQAILFFCQTYIPVMEGTSIPSEAHKPLSKDRLISEGEA